MPPQPETENSAEATVTEASAPEASPVELTDAQKAAAHRDARNAVRRFLGNPTGQADTMVRELTVEEQQRIVAAAGDRDTARDAIKQVLTDAYERRRKEHEAAAQDTRARHDQRDAVRLALFNAGAPREDVAAFLLAMREQALYQAVMQRAAEGGEPASAEGPTLEPGWSPEEEAKFQDAAAGNEEVTGDVEESSAAAPAPEAPAADAAASDQEPAPSAEPVPEPAPAAEAPATEPAPAKPAAKKPTP
jgi:hypothetical protein